MNKYIEKVCSFHTFRKAIYLRISAVSPDDDKIMMCEDCRERLLELLGQESLHSLKVERI